MPGRSAPPCRGSARPPAGSRCSRTRAGPGRFAEHRHVTGDPLRVVADQSAEAVAGGLDLLLVVEHPGHVAGGLGDDGGQRQLDRDAALHVDGPASPDLRVLPHLEVLRDGDAVVARTHLGRTERVVVAGHLDTVPAEYPYMADAHA